MALSIDISTDDLARVERLLRSALSQLVPAGNFREGSFLNDVVIRAMAVVPAIVEKEAAAVRNRQSLNTIAELPVTDVDQALEDLVSNWFVTRKAGTYSTGVATVHMSPEVDEVISIPPTTTFTYAPGIQFSVDSTDYLVLNRDEQLTPVYAADGSVSEYLLYVPIVSVSLGAIGNVPAGLFQGFDSFSPFIRYVELENTIATATATETNSSLIERAKSSLSDRSMLTSKSIKAVLREEFVDVTDVYVVGAGAPEMHRDLLTDTAFSVSVHVLGHVNVYCLLPVVRNARSTTASVADGVSTVAVTTAATSNFPFLRLRTVATGSTTLVRCSLSPYDDNGVTRYVAYRSGDASTTVRNTSTLLADEYSLAVGDTDTFGSMEQSLSLLVGGTTGTRTYDITYDGTRGLYAPHLLLKDRERRVTASNALAYSFVPVVLKFAISWAKKSTAPSALPVDQAKSDIAAYINNRLFTGGIRVSDIVVFFMGEYSAYVQGVALPVEVSYYLQSPSGVEVPFASKDVISVEDMSSLLDARTYSTAQRLQEQVSDATVRFVTFEDLITLTELK